VGDLFDEDDATPLTPQERRELIPTHIAYRRELNEAEQENIVRAQDWAFGRRRDPLTEKFIKELHRRMLGGVWRRPSWSTIFSASRRSPRSSDTMRRSRSAP
jgi:fido (protein-threonine AMPylation protein)